MYSCSSLLTDTGKELAEMSWAETFMRGLLHFSEPITICDRFNFATLP